MWPSVKGFVLTTAWLVSHCVKSACQCVKSALCTDGTGGTLPCLQSDQLEKRRQCDQLLSQESQGKVTSHRVRRAKAKSGQSLRQKSQCKVTSQKQATDQSIHSRAKGTAVRTSNSKQPISHKHTHTHTQTHTHTHAHTHTHTHTHTHAHTHTHTHTHTPSVRAVFFASAPELSHQIDESLTCTNKSLWNRDGMVCSRKRTLDVVEREFRVLAMRTLG